MGPNCQTQCPLTQRYWRTLKYSTFSHGTLYHSMTWIFGKNFDPPLAHMIKIYQVCQVFMGCISFFCSKVQRSNGKHPARGKTQQQGPNGRTTSGKIFSLPCQGGICSSFFRILSTGCKCTYLFLCLICNHSYLYLYIYIYIYIHVYLYYRYLRAHTHS